MIIECIQKRLIMDICRIHRRGSGDGQAEESGYLVVDHGLAHCRKLITRQNVEHR